MYYFLLVPIFFALLLGGLSFSAPQASTFDPNTVQSQSLITTAPHKSNGTMAFGSFDVHTTFIPTPTLTLVPTNTPTQPSSNVLGLGTHGAFNIYTPEEVKAAHDAGVTYNIIDYYGCTRRNNTDPFAGIQDCRNESQVAWDVDPTTSLGKAMQQYGMKGFLMLTNADILNYNSGTGNFSPNYQKLTNYVKQYYNSPLLGGYWIKDDDPQLCGDGTFSVPLTSILQKEYSLIRQIDKNPNHVIMAGFCDSADLAKNWYPKGASSAPIADAVGMYPYPNLYYRWSYFTDFPTEIKKEVSIIKQNTPSTVPLPAMVGIYEGFFSDHAWCVNFNYHCTNGVPAISHAELIKDIGTFMSNGFDGVVDFAFEAQDVDHTAGNDATMLQYVKDTTSYLKSIGKYP